MRPRLPTRRAPGGKAGRPPFPPGTLPELHRYSYLNDIRSSRRLEREAVRNLEAIWLADGLRPYHASLVGFRKANGAALKAANKDFVLLCKGLGLLGGEVVAVDGSFFMGDTAAHNVYTAERLDGELAELDKKVGDYQRALAEQDAADDRAGVGGLADDPQLPQKLDALRARQAEKRGLQRRLEAGGGKQLGTVDEDARLPAKRGRTVAGYNVQIAVDPSTSSGVYSK